MVPIPPEVQILSTLQIGSVYYFEDIRLSSSEPHYFIVLNKNPKEDTVLFMPCASSKVQKRVEAASRLGFHKDTLVIVTPAEYSCFKVETVVDCNRIFEKTTLSLIDKLSQNQLKVCNEVMPKHLIEKMVQGVLLSNQVSEDFKNYIRP